MNTQVHITENKIKDKYGLKSEISGNTVSLRDASNFEILGLTLYGATTQTAQPSIEEPQDLINVSNDGSIVTKVCGTNLFNPSCVSAGNAYSPTQAAILTNLYGTTINSTTYDEKVIVTQTIFTDSSKPHSYTNGYFMFGLYNNILKFDKEYTFIADIKITNNLGETGILYAQLPKSNITGVIKNNKLYFNFIFTQDASAPQKRFIDIRCNGMSFELSNIMIVEGNALNTDLKYEPFQEQTFILNTPNGLPGYPYKYENNYIDENGQGWISDEIDLVRGKYIQRVEKVVFTGNESFKQYTSTTRGLLALTTVNKKIKYLTANTSFLCNYFNSVIIGNSNGTRLQFYIEENGFNSIDAFVEFVKDKYNAGNPITVIYPLAEPIETDLDLTDWEIEQYKALTTHKPITTIFNDADAYMSINYIADTKAYIDNQIDDYFNTIETSIISLGGNV